MIHSAAAARPRCDPARKKDFDGKIGIWPFCINDFAKRSSKNRKKGGPATAPIASVAKEISKKWLIKKALLAARDKFPASRKRRPIFIQQGNAKPHALPNDEDAAREGGTDGWDARLANQPPNSPDFSALNLGFFNAIQLLQYESAPKIAKELAAAVEQAFRNLKLEKLGKALASLQCCLKESMPIGGKNCCKLPHLSKAKPAKGQLDPTAIQCRGDAIEAAKGESKAMSAKQELLAAKKRLLASRQQSPQRRKQPSAARSRRQ